MQKCTWGFKTLALISALAIFSCNENKSKNSGEMDQSNLTIPSAHKDTSLTCYLLDNGKDKIAIQIKADGNEASGQLLYRYFQKDKNTGTFTGKMYGDTLIADYKFESEGRVSNRQVAFIKRGDQLVEGFSNKHDTAGNPDMAERASINFQNIFILHKITCKLDEHGCNTLMDEAWSSLQNKCLTLASQAITLNTLQENPKNPNPAYLIFSSNRHQAEVYLPGSDKSIILNRTGKEGNWNWHNDSLKIFIWKGYILQRRGVSEFGGDEM